MFAEEVVGQIQFNQTVQLLQPCKGGRGREEEREGGEGKEGERERRGKEGKGEERREGGTGEGWR